MNEKKSYIKHIIFFLGVLGVLYLAYLDLQKDIFKTTQAFLNNQELLCDNYIVSQDKGYRVYEKDESFITNNEKMFLIRQCRIKDKQ
jgi:hypothetical protein